MSHVGNRFLIRPLIPAFEEPDVPALVLSQGGASLFELTNDGARRVDVDLPGSVQDLNWFVDRESRLQQRPEPPTTHGSGFHGHSPREDEDEDLRRYLRAVGSVVNEALDDDSRPIVVAAPDDLRGRVEPHLGREVIAHAALNPQAPESEVADELQPVRTRLRAESRSELREHLAQSIGRGQAIVDLKESLVAGAQGRIDTLAVAIDTPAVWGVLDEEAQRVTIHETPADGDTDLLDRLAAVTLSRGGRVRSLEGPLDEGHGFVAIPRY